MIDWLNRTELLDNSILLWLYAAATAVIGYLVVDLGLRFTARRVRERHARAPSTARAVALALLDATRHGLILLLAVVLAAGMLQFNPLAERILGHVSFALVGLQIALWANALIKLWLRNAQREQDDTPINPVLVGMLVWAMQLVVWTVLLLAFLANIGVNVTTLVASLGIGGVAVALALQNVLGDLFSSIAIGLDKPFEVGQFIAFGDVLGTVVHVGVKTTRIDSLSGEQLVISNSNLLNQLVHNYSRMPQRRVVFGFRLPYDTPPDAVEHIIAQARSYIEAAQPTRFDRGHLANFGEYGLEFEFVYYVLTSDYTVYRNIQQQVNLRIMKLLSGMDVKFAVPARVLSMTTGSALSSPS
jgi:small-conductance mechanosensitive channel